MRACRARGSEEVADALPADGPDRDSAEHDVSGNWSSSDENAGYRLGAPSASPAPFPVRFCLGPDYGAVPHVASAAPPASGWYSRIKEVMRQEEIGSLSSPLECWSHEEQFRPAAVGRRIFSDPIFMGGIGSAPLHQTRSDSDIPTRASTIVGAERVPSEEFWTLNDVGESVAVLKGRDFAARALPQRPACAYCHEFRFGARLGRKASGKLAQHPLMSLMSPSLPCHTLFRRRWVGYAI